jgi:hypothetical protein
MKAIICAILLVHGAFGSVVSAGSASANGPDLHFRERTYDFGFSGQNRQIMYRFEFTNAGGGLLTVEAVKSSCGCVVSLTPSNGLNPGSSGAVEVTCATGKRIGQMIEIIRVCSNDRDEPEIELKVTGVVRAEYALDPESLSLGDIERGAPVARILRLVDLGDTELVVQRVEVDEKYFVSEFGRFEDGPLHGFVIQLLLKPDAPPGRFALPLTIHMNLPRHPRIDVPIVGNILGRIRVSPDFLSLGKLNEGDSPKERLYVSAIDQTGFGISGLSMEPHVLSPQLWCLERGFGYEITFRAADSVVEGGFAARLVIRTSDPNQPQIEVPVRGMFVRVPRDVSPPMPDAHSQTSAMGNQHVYITRPLLEEDTYLSAWLIKRFVDPNAEFRFVPPDQPVREGTGTLFDLPDGRARWRRTQWGCTSEHVLADVKNPDHVVKELVAHVRKLERGSWLVSPNSDTARLSSYVQKANEGIRDADLRMEKVFAYFDTICKHAGRIPE